MIYGCCDIHHVFIVSILTTRRCLGWRVCLCVVVVVVVVLILAIMIVIRTILLWTVFHSVPPGVSNDIVNDDYNNCDGAMEVQTDFVPSQNFNFVTIFTIHHPSRLFYNTNNSKTIPNLVHTIKCWSCSLACDNYLLDLYTTTCYRRY